MAEGQELRRPNDNKMKEGHLTLEEPALRSERSCKARRYDEVYHSPSPALGGGGVQPGPTSWCDHAHRPGLRLQRYRGLREQICKTT